MIDLLGGMSPVDAALSALALGALGLVIYLAWASRRLSRLDRAEAIVTRVLSQTEVERILNIADELTRQGARRGERNPG